MNPILIKLAIAAVSLIAAFTTGWMVKGWQVDSNTLDAYQEAVKRGNDLGNKLEVTLSKLEDNKFIVQKEVRHETVKQIYTSCVVPVDGIRLFNASASDSGEPKD